MYSIIYLSKASTDFNEQELATILTSSRINNQRNSITGILLYKQGYFLQMLEGYQQNVIEIYDKINDDPRHEQVELMWQSDINKRMFPGWTMGFCEPAGNLDIVSSMKNCESALSFLRQFSQPLNSVG